MSDLVKTPERLKQSILQEAMQGKLTKQLPSDDNVNDLLNKINIDKFKQIKKGKFRKRKPLLPITNKEILFSIPNNWKWIRLDTIGSWEARGATPKKSNPHNYIGDIPWVRSGDLNDSYINNTPVTISKNAVSKASLKLLPKGSILIGRVGATIAKLGILNIKATVNDACYACIPCDIDKIYLFYYLLSQREQIINLGNGGAQPTISITKMRHYPFPLPPLSEQHRIVQRLNEILPKVDDLNKDVVKLDQIRIKFPHRLKQSLLLEAMKGHLTQQLPSDGNADDLLQLVQQKKQQLIQAGKIRKHKKLPPISKNEIPFKIPKNWKWARIPDISTFPDQKQVKPADISSDTWVLDLKDISENTGIIKHHVLKKDKKVRSNKNIFHKNDVLYGKLRPYLNKVVVADDNGVSTTEIFVLHILGNINPTFISMALRSPFFLNKVNADTYGTKMPRAGTRKFKYYIVPLPPLPEQHRIVSKLHDLFNTINA